MKLRLLVTDQCNRTCKGCCNKDWDLPGLPVVTPADAMRAEIIMLTGGEPMLFPNKLADMLEMQRSFWPHAKLVVYTALLHPLSRAIQIIELADGMTITIHDNSDIENVHRLQVLEPQLMRRKDMYLNIFRSVTQPVPVWPGLWKRVKVVDWIKNCPLPSDEEFRRIAIPFQRG